MTKDKSKHRARIVSVRKIPILQCITIVLLLQASGVSMSETALSERIDLTMRVNTKLKDILAMNPGLHKGGHFKLRKNGIITINGPSKFHFLYAKQKSLSYDDVKLIIFPVENSKVNYIHIFPQMDDMSKLQLMDRINTIGVELKQAGWVKQDMLLNDEDKKLQETGRRDFARYQLKLDRAFDRTRHYEIVLNTYIDEKIVCPPVKSDTILDQECHNRFLRVGFYGFEQ